MLSGRKLAQLAGVSPSTISRALRNDPRIRPETRKRIQDLADLYHYRPVPMEKALVAGNSLSIGCVVPVVNSVFFSSVVRGVLERAFEESYHVITLQTKCSDITTACKALETLVELQVEGILLASGSYTAIPRASLLAVWSAGVKLVGIENVPTMLPIDQVELDLESTIEMVLQYLLALGHRRIAYAGPCIDIDRYSILIRKSLQRMGLPASYIWDTVEEPGLRPMLAHWSTLPESPTAIITYSDPVAAQLLQHAAQLGLCIPREMTIIGRTNLLPFVELLYPPLTSIETHPLVLGQRAFDLLLRRINEDQQHGQAPREVIRIAPTLVERESAGPPRKTRHPMCR
ncbi:MAG: LacI family DNA-binding transcriptional regulator [Armatimonadota bacterium]